MPADLETRNKFIVGLHRGEVLIGTSVEAPLSPNDALLLAAWLVAVAAPHAVQDFDELLAEVQGS